MFFIGWRRYWFYVETFGFYDAALCLCGFSLMGCEPTERGKHCAERKKIVIFAVDRLCLACVGRLWDAVYMWVRGHRLVPYLRMNITMIIMKKRLKTLFVMLAAVLAASAQKGMEFDLWPGKAPGNNGDPNDVAKVYVYLPDAKKATGRAVVICPGGAYTVLAMGHEGKDWAQFFNGQGIAAIVLKYRMPHGNRNIPVSDAEEAMRMVRRNATAWHIDSNQVGIMGSSAGGHLASTVATKAKGDAAPNFQILFYPVITMDPSFTHKGSHDNLLGANPGKKLERLYSSDQQVTRTTPRAFIALSDDDDVVLPANGINYYLECYRHDVPASLYVYPTGGHGWGILQSFPYHIEMILNLKAWLNSF